MKVKCINNYLNRKYLTEVKIYNVELNEKRGYTIVDDTGNLFVYPSYRFEIVVNSPVVTTLKTIKAINTKYIVKKAVIEKGSEYIVLEETNKHYYVINDKGQITNYPKTNFQIVRG